MSRWTVLALGIGAVLFCTLNGCGASMTQTADARDRQWKRIYRYDYLSMQEDIDLVFMKERNTRLTRWHER